ncbi:MAG: protein-glutamate O-methyltransferase CheR [Maricaulis sp.]|jgi:chemotaxis protein methyltransferase CheR|uniref:CheR family methyltransferase n=1 Tax=Maricaulis sp. TaxID=1486257 RepID=UPI001B0E805F|nr:protein-glutamate O-methyltransferase CheR [Maricaulis sp.]MBO6847960.1 protein-glutamate O-methyltransferase CheR [Maricaulis sp.]MBO6877662.1 protein-glutamate O-methyltransferase CheR [Maricaulis sp.]MDM7984090.1 protein-glutamate O-methyltransferase CheR [Maricaulis sp.]
MIKQDDITFVAAEAFKRSGLVLSADKGYLLESRLAPLARAEGFPSIDALLTAARRDQGDRLLWAITEALATHETFFFRDNTPFDLFKNDILPVLTRARGAGSTIRIWCAACSSGQEPYSLAMLLEEERARLGGKRFEIIATDMAPRVLEKAEAGVYSQFEVQRGLAIQRLVQHFEQNGDQWRIKPNIRQMVNFQKHNLLEPIASLGTFDVVFCRNVLIYFDPETKKQVLSRIARQTPNDGYLIMGAAETVVGLSKDFVPVEGKRGLYVRSEAGSGRTTRAA